MLALAGAVSFLIGLILHLFEVHTSHVFSSPTWLFLGLLLFALHQAGVGGPWRRGQTSA